jgi:hypothetical protein
MMNAVNSENIMAEFSLVYQGLKDQQIVFAESKQKYTDIEKQISDHLAERTELFQRIGAEMVNFQGMMQHHSQQDNPRMQVFS